MFARNGYRLSVIGFPQKKSPNKLNGFTPVSSKSGFTLIELMVTIAIVALLATIGIVVYATAQKTARISKRQQDLEALRTAVELYKSSNGAYLVQSAAATCSNSATALANLAPTFMNVIPSDPSGGTNCYKYQSDTAGSEYKIWTSNAEMTSAEYNTQPGLIDPNRDGGTSNGCAIESGTRTAWAYYTPGACSF